MATAVDNTVQTHVCSHPKLESAGPKAGKLIYSCTSCLKDIQEYDPQTDKTKCLVCGAELSPFTGRCNCPAH
jgi:hypothetical protein